MAKKTNLIRIEPEEGKVFDWAEPRYIKDEEGELVQEHLYAKLIFLSTGDTEDNYIQIVKPIDNIDEEV